MVINKCMVNNNKTTQANEALLKGIEAQHPENSLLVVAKKKHIANRNSNYSESGRKMINHCKVNLNSVTGYERTNS